MDDFYQRPNWPLVALAKGPDSPETVRSVSPEQSADKSLKRGEEDDGVSMELQGDQGFSDDSSEGDVQDDVSDLYEDEEEELARRTKQAERNGVTPFSSVGTNGALMALEQTRANHVETNGQNGHTTPPNPDNRPNSTLKGTPPSQILTRSPSITAQIPQNRQRVRWSWQSAQDEEPNRPRIHVIKLVSNTATASAGFPGGEAFGFSISPYGRRIAAYNSARLYILQSAALPVGVSQDYALKRRPLAVEIVDEGNTLAILADDYTVNVYDLGHQLLERVRTIKLDFPTNCIALAPTGGLLAAGYEGGVEVFSLDPHALPTDRRAVRSQKMDKLCFSRDGSTIIGTTTRINVSSTVVVSVPIFPSSASGVPTHEELKEAWCSELLHPENIRNSSHATFLRENRETRNDRLFAWNGLEDTFGILRLPDMIYTNVDFPVVINPPLSTVGGLGAAIHSCPDVDEHGDAVAMIVNDRTLRLYLIPPNQDAMDTIVEAHSIDHELDEGYGCPFTDVRWVQSGNSLPAPIDNPTKQVRGRLVIASPGAVTEELNEEDLDVEDTEGGRIILFDFDPQYIGQPGQTFSLTLGNSPPQLLDEPKLDVAHEIAIIRRRTVNQSKGATLHQRPATLGRSATSAGNRTTERPPRATPPMVATNVNRRSIVSIHSMQSDLTRSLPDLLESNEASDTFEEPYAQNAPRSHASLQRAASNAQRHRFQSLEERNQERVSVDSNGQFLPLPEYTEEPNAPLPSRFRAMAGLDTPAQPPASKAAVITSEDGDRLSPVSSAPSTAPAAVAETFNSEEAFASASNGAQNMEERQSNEEDVQTGLAPAPAVDRTSTESSSIVPVSESPPSLPTMARSDTFQSFNDMNPRFLQRAYANAAGNPGAVIPLRRGSDDTNAGSPTERPQMQRNISAPLDRLNTGGDAPDSRPWDQVSPLPPATPSSHAAGGANATPSRAPSSSSFAPSSLSASAPSYREARLPPHMQAFRNAAATNAVNTSASLFPLTQPSTQIPIPEHAQPPNNGGYAITSWRPPGPSTVSAPPTRQAHQPSLSGGHPSPPTLKTKNSGFFRRGTKKHDRLFGPEFASKQPGANLNPIPPGSSGSGGSGGGTVAETKSVFTFKTKRGDAKCAVM